MIIDASVAFKWLVEEPDSAIAISWLDCNDLKAPHLIHSECGNALFKRIRGGEIFAEGASTQLAGLKEIVTLVDEQPWLGRALSMSITLDHSFYDCVYLALSEGLDDRLLTADSKFISKTAASEWASLVHPWRAM
jgi:predicted nucleic acid-binding protein